MLQNFINIFSENKGQCDNNLLNFLIKQKVNVRILY